MKKIIALLLALIMTFSVATVAFATEGEIAPEAPEVEVEGDGSITDSIDEMLGEYSWILDLPFSSLKPALKIAKIALKLVLVYVKICRVFGLDPMETAQSIISFIGGFIEENAPETDATETPEEATAPAAA